VLSGARTSLRLARATRVLPPAVARFYRDAQLQARRDGDDFSLASVTRPAELAGLLALAEGRVHVVELGTATAWTAIAFALADERRGVIAYDPVVHAPRERYLGLVDAPVRARIELRDVPDSEGPRTGDAAVEMLFVDSSHDRDSVLRAVDVWSPALASGAIVAFHDYGHPQFPGVRAAIEQLGLPGESRGGLFVWRP
jgi:predicted O-methyltransferase YrrM